MQTLISKRNEQFFFKPHVTRDTRVPNTRHGIPEEKQTSTAGAVRLIKG